MKKTSVYLTEEDLARLRRLAAIEGVSQALVVREAISAYDTSVRTGGPASRPSTAPESGEEEVIGCLGEEESGSRTFALDGCVIGDGTSAADIPEEDYLDGFGE